MNLKKIMTINTLLICGFVVMACSHKSQPEIIQINEDKRYLRLEYKFAMQVGLNDTSGSVGTVLTYDIDQMTNRVFEKYHDSNPIEYIIQSNSNSASSKILGSQDSLIYNSENYIIARSDEKFDINGHSCIRFTVENVSNNLTQIVYILPQGNSKVRFPLKYFSLDKSKNNNLKIPLFNPMLFELGIPVVIQTPMENSGMRKILADQIDHPLILEKNNMKLEIEESIFLTLNLTEIEFIDDHMKIELK